jgi:hypothetical protein
MLSSKGGPLQRFETYSMFRYVLMASRLYIGKLTDADKDDWYVVFFAEL